MQILPGVPNNRFVTQAAESGLLSLAIWFRLPANLPNYRIVTQEEESRLLSDEMGFQVPPVLPNVIVRETWLVLRK